MNSALCYEILSKLHEFSCSPQLTSEMSVAKELFAIATGKANDDDPFFESRMQAFQEYFLFDFRMSHVLPGATPLECYLFEQSKDLKPKVLMDFEFFRSFRHSLFRVEKHQVERLIVLDYFSGNKLMVYPLPQFQFLGFEVGQIFEGRIIFFHGTPFFTGVFTFHAKEVRPTIEKMLRTVFNQKRKDFSNYDFDWKSELQRRSQVLSHMAEQYRVMAKNDKLKGVDILKVSRLVASVSNTVSHPPLVMSLGRKETISPYVPEAPFYDISSFLQKLCLLQIKIFRYRHIDPVRIYQGATDVPSEPLTPADAKHFNNAEPTSGDETLSPLVSAS